MESKARLLGHAVHPLLIVFPLGLLSTAVIFDVINFIRGDVLSGTVSFWMIAAGIVGGLVAAPFGWIDWTAIPRGTRARSVGLVHGLVNTTVVLLFAVSLYLRIDGVVPPTSAMILSGIGFVLALIGGWLGGELIERMGIAVHPGANPNAPSSLTTATSAIPSSLNATVKR
jgi:uncharacterized membrane protein